jgi:putative Mg2+ transporter-C (MgtC) family protein
MMDHWEIIDLYKALLALAAGIILGSEREFKDKAAGLKTITVICLGSALFAIISYKVGVADHETTRIASYIVSGVGFIGAGVIFKDGANVSGLTTAGIIWVAAAVGTAIGFGEFYLAATFMVASLVIVFSSPIIDRLFRAKKQQRKLSFSIERRHQEHKDRILAALVRGGIDIDETNLEMRQDILRVSAEISISKEKLKWLEQFLSQEEHIISFSL